MKHFIFSGSLRLILAVALALGAVSSRAEEPVAPKPVDPPKADPLPDPTRPSDRLRQALRKPEKPAPESAPTPPPAPPKLPEVVVKGWVAGADGQGFAIIEVNGKERVTVRAGDTLTVRDDSGQPIQMKVRKISSLAVEIEVPALQQVIEAR